MIFFFIFFGPYAGEIRTRRGVGPDEVVDRVPGPGRHLGACGYDRPGRARGCAGAGGEIERQIERHRERDADVHGIDESARTSKGTRPDGLAST